MTIKQPICHAIIRGQLVDTNFIEFGGRSGDLSFLAPDPQSIVSRLPLGSPAAMNDLYELSFDEILDYLEELGGKLDINTNDYMREARELSYAAAPSTPPIIDSFYAHLPQMFDRERVRAWADLAVGVRYLDGWVDAPINNSTLSIRAYGSRALHVIAGNGPVLGAMTLLRGAVTRSDTIVKVPSNDPFTTPAIARTMRDFAPDHPITKHFSVAYWRGGDEEFERKLYQPHNIEKIVAWGGFASVKHVTKYIQPGLELISLDPKRSASVVGREVRDSEEMLHEAAFRIAADVGAINQLACSNCRVVYLLSGTDSKGLATANRLGQLVYDAMMNLPEQLSTKPKSFNPELKANIDSLRLSDDWFNVIGGTAGEGAVIVSQTSDAVDFVETLNDRTVNIVPVDTTEEVLGAVDSYTQTIGIFPDSLTSQFRHMMALHGGQRFVSLGYAAAGPGLVGPQDGIEPLRRMCKWIICERNDPGTKPPWERTNGEPMYAL